MISEQMIHTADGKSKMVTQSTNLQTVNRTEYNFETESLEGIDTATLCTILCIAVLSNTILIVLESKVWIQRKRLSQPKLLIILLSLIDALCCVFGILPRLVISTMTPCFSSSYLEMYMFTRFILGCFSILSKLTVVLMAVERFISIRAPFFYVRNCSVKMFTIVHVFLVMYSLLNGTVMVFLDRNLFRTFLENNNGVTHRNCQSLFLSLEYDVYPKRSLMKWKFAPISNGFTVFSLIQDFILIVMLFICNTSVISGLNGMERRLRESCPRPSNDRRNAQDLMAMSGKEFSRLMIAINIVVVLLITPNMIRTLCNYIDIHRSLVADFVCYRVALCSACVNPFLYGLLRRKLRRSMRVCLSKWCCCCRPNDISPMELTRVTDSQIR